MVKGLPQIQNNYNPNTPVNVTSGYRSPKVQYKHSHPHDRHIHGDAVDLASTQATYVKLRTAALQASSQQTCVEDFATAQIDCQKAVPQCNPFNHVHVDWRRVAIPAPPTTESCKASYMK